MILEVDQTATIEVINRAYKRLALKHHPDRNAHRDTTAAFQLVCQTDRRDVGFSVFNRKIIRHVLKYAF